MAAADAWVMIPKLNKDTTECTIQIMPLVLCKDCKYHDPNDGICDCNHGIRWGLLTPDNWFCASGEMK